MWGGAIECSDGGFWFCFCLLWSYENSVHELDNSPVAHS